MNRKNALSLECLAIGSLPHDSVKKAMEVVKRNFKTIPFWPQMTKLSKNEDMIIQFTENMPSFFVEERCFRYNKKQTESFLADYREITNKGLKSILEKYGLSSSYSIAFESFLELVEKTKPDFAKGQVTGAFTLSTSLVDERGNYAFYNKNLREIILKTVILKVLWQIEKLKYVNPKIKPIIFIDEPNLSYLGSLKFSNIRKSEVIGMIKPVSDIIKQYGGLSGIHCCGSCDWAIPVKSGVDIINLNVFFFEKELELYLEDLKIFLENGGKIAWSVIPTMNKELLKKADLKDMISIFENAVKYLTKKGIDEKIIMENSLITSSCGTSTLSVEMAEKAMKLVRELSDNRKAIWHSN